MSAVLVFRTAALGDFVMTLPALAQLRQSFPGRKIILLTIQTTHKSTQKLVAAYAGGCNVVPWVGMAMPHLVDDVLVMSSFSRWADLKILRQLLKGINFEAGILMVESGAPWLGRLKKRLLLACALPGLPIYGWRGRSFFQNTLSRFRGLGSLRHHVHGPLQFLSELPSPRGYKDVDLVFDLRPGVEADHWAKSWLEARGLGECYLIAIAPGAIQPHKQWPLSSFMLLLHRLLDFNPCIRVVIIGTPSDRELGDLLCAKDPLRVFNVAGESSILQSAALLTHVRLLIGNDGGAMHLGDAMGCKVISIMPGIEYPNSVEPWHNKNLAVRWPVDCAPCYSFTCCPQGHRRCMLELPVDAVWAKCQTVL